MPNLAQLGKMSKIRQKGQYLEKCAKLGKIDKIRQNGPNEPKYVF